MYLPSGGGPYGPYGDYEGPVDIYGDGWRHRLVNYGHERLSEERRAFYGGGRRYAYCVTEKFLYECGHKQPGPDDVVVTPIEDHEPPRFFQTRQGYKQLSSIISLPGRFWAVDDAVKAIIERLEPSIHQFYSLDIRMPRGKVYPINYHVLVVGTYLDSFVPEESDPGSFRPYEANGLKWYGVDGSKSGITGLALRKDVCGDAHLWRERGLNEWLLCFSGELEAAFKAAGLKLPKYYRMRDL
jgi:hypothetical protein